MSELRANHVIRRRAFVVLLAVGVLPASWTAGAQQRKVFRVGFLAPGPQNIYEETYLGALRQHGYTEGQNLVIERRLGTAEDLPSMAVELVRMKVDVIYAGASSGVRAAVNASPTIPIVAVDLETDPIASGYVSTLARPGGNLTGFFLDLPEFSAKRLEVLKEALPTVIRVTVLWDGSLDRAPLSRMNAAARTLKLQLTFADIHEAADLDGAFQAASDRKAQAVMVMQSPTLDGYKDQILSLGAQHRLPVFAVFANFAVDGALLSYGPDIHDLVARSVSYVDRLLRGAHAGDLPIQRPTKFDLVVNLKTARLLGLKIGQSVLLRADEVIR